LGGRGVHPGSDVVVVPRSHGPGRQNRGVSADVGTAVVAHPLQDRQFRWFFLGRLVSMTGSSMVWVALTFAILEASGSAGDLGIVLAAYTVPLGLFQLFGGVVADRFSRSAVLVVSHLGAALTQGVMATLLLTGNYRLLLVAALAALNGALQAVSGPALVGIVPELVPRPAIQRANALLGGTRNATRVAGPALAGLLVAGAGGGWAIAVDAAAYLVAAACMSRLRLPAPVRAAGATVLRDLREGWSVFRSMTWVWVGAVTLAVLNFLQAGVWGVLGPLLAEDTFGAAAWGLVLSASAVGFVLSSVVMYRVTFRYLLGIGHLCLAFQAVPLVLLGMDVPVPVLIAGAFLSGAGTGVYGIAYETSVHEHVPGDKLSRVASIDMLAALWPVPLGQLAVIPAAAAFGGARVAVVWGVAFAVVALAVLAVRPVRALRHATG
jgi:MFS family permease